MSWVQSLTMIWTSVEEARRKKSSLKSKKKKRITRPKASIDRMKHAFAGFVTKRLAGVRYAKQGPEEYSTPLSKKQIYKFLTPCTAFTVLRLKDEMLPFAACPPHGQILGHGA